MSDTDPTPDPAAVPEPPTPEALTYDVWRKTVHNGESQYPEHFAWLAFHARDAELAAMQAAGNELQDELDRLRARVAELEEYNGELNKETTEIVNAAHAAGWNGVDNSKFLVQFITDTATERDALAAANARLTADLEALREGLRALKQVVVMHPVTASGQDVFANPYDVRAMIDALLAPPAPPTPGGPT